MLHKFEVLGVASSKWMALAALGPAAVVFAFLALGDSAAGAPQGVPAALAGHVVVLADSGPPSDAANQFARAECPKGKGVIAGGYSLNPGGIDNVDIVDNHPSGEFSVQEPNGPPIVTQDGWFVGATRVGNEVWSVQAYAVCVSTD